MIRDSIRSATLKAIRYDPVTLELFVESVGGAVFRHAPVQYAIYSAIATSRFPEKIYRHLIADHILPEVVVGLNEINRPGAGADRSSPVVILAEECNKTLIPRQGYAPANIVSSVESASKTILRIFSAPISLLIELNTVRVFFIKD